MATGQPSPTLVVGLTGGIASGKSTVAAALAARGAAWIDADQIARDLVAPGSPLLAEVIAAFGADLLDERGALRRKALGAIVFADAAARARLEALLHPAIAAEIGARLAAARSAGRPVALIDAALLLELGLDAGVDRVVAVTAPLPARLRRLAQRDGLDEAAGRARVAAQAPEQALLARADWVVRNDGELATLADAVDRLWAWLGEQRPAREGR